VHVLSVNVSSGQLVEYDGMPVPTGIFKTSVDGRVRVHRLGLDGDRVVDLTVHGGEWKAVYAYSWEHYAWWEKELPHADLEPGAFGENLTIAGLDEEDIAVGDVLEVGEAQLVAIQPRQPCFKLGIRFGDPQMVKRFHESGRWGIYFRVAREGMIARGDAVTVVARAARRLPVPELYRIRHGAARPADEIRQALAVPDLAPRWREILSAKLTELSID
jgi:MOSC domain-containing protein YiiM